MIAVVESPYGNKDETQVAINIMYARLCLYVAIKMGYTPFASHLLYTQPAILDDSIIKERSLGIECGLEMLSVATVSLVFTDLGFSNGMKLGITAAKKRGVEVKMISLREKEGGYLNNDQRRLLLAILDRDIDKIHSLDITYRNGWRLL